MSIIESIIVFAALLAASSLIYWTIKLGIGPVPSSRLVSKTLFNALPDNVNGKIFELGCGWGNLISVLKKKYPDHTIIGYERSPIPRRVSSWLFRIPVYGKDFFKAGLPEAEEAGLITCYLYPQAMKRVTEELLPTLPAGCFIITHTFALPGIQPISIHRSADIYRTPVYLYRITPNNASKTNFRSGSEASG